MSRHSAPEQFDDSHESHQPVSPEPISPEHLEQVRALVREMENAVREIQRSTNASGTHNGVSEQ